MDGWAYLGYTVLDNLLTGQIRLVADQEFVHTLRGISIDFLEPLLYVRESIYGVRTEISV